MKTPVFHQCGDASQIQIEDVPKLQIGAGQVLIWTGSNIAGLIKRLILNGYSKSPLHAKYDAKFKGGFYGNVEMSNM